MLSDGTLLFQPKDVEDPSTGHVLNASIETFLEQTEPLAFLEYLGETSLVWLFPDSCMSFDEQDDYAYSLTIKIDPLGQLTISAGSVSDASATLACLFRLFAKSPMPVHLICQAFATQPRQPFPSLAAHFDQLQVVAGSSITSVCISFLYLNAATAEWLATVVPTLELKQSTVEQGIGAAVTNAMSLSKLTVSCTMPEFAMFAISPNLRELNLLLHFWLQGEPWTCFCQSICNATSLTTVSIRYLDIGDDPWSELMQALRFNSTITSLSMAFTDNFVDNYRRLTPERRSLRSTAVLEMLQENSTLESFCWPVFQQDENLMTAIHDKLKANNKTLLFTD
jgi:hypothetical protein